MSQTQGLVVRIRWTPTQDRLNPERTGKQLVKLEGLVAEVAKMWLEALELGVYQGRKDYGRASQGDTDPTSSAALSMTQKQVRGTAKRAAILVEQSVAIMEEAANTLHGGIRFTDHDEWTGHQEKRAAATQE